MIVKDSLLNIDKFNAINELERQYNKVKNEETLILEGNLSVPLSQRKKEMILKVLEGRG
jgi:hypothetical protein